MALQHGTSADTFAGKLLFMHHIIIVARIQLLDSSEVDTSSRFLFLRCKAHSTKKNSLYKTTGKFRYVDRQTSIVYPAQCSLAYRNQQHKASVRKQKEENVNAAWIAKAREGNKERMQSKGGKSHAVIF